MYDDNWYTELTDDPVKNYCFFRYLNDDVPIKCESCLLTPCILFQLDGQRIADAAEYRAEYREEESDSEWIRSYIYQEMAKALKARGVLKYDGDEVIIPHCVNSFAQNHFSPEMGGPCTSRVLVDPQDCFGFKKNAFVQEEGAI